MPFAAALWFLLLHAIAGIALPTVRVEVCPGSLPVACDASRAAHSNNGQRHASATPQHLPAESVRASYAAPITAVVRPSWRSPATATPVLHECDDAARLELAFIASAILRRSDDEIHRSSRDTRFVSYYPTAPPHLA